MTYARAIRLSLAASRDCGLDFPSAWAIALEDNPPVMHGHDGWQDALPFLMRTMRDAYERKPFSPKQKPTRIVPLSERTEAVTGRYTRSERGRTSLERSAVQIG